MTSIFSNLQNILGMGQAYGPSMPEMQGPSQPSPSIGSQISEGYTKISDQPGFNSALMKLGSTLLAARENGMGLGEGLLAGQTAFNSETEKAQKDLALKAAAKLEMQKFMTDNAFKLNTANLEQSKFGLEKDKYGLEQKKFANLSDIEKQKLALEYFRINHEGNKPQSPEAKLTSDFNAGLIDKDTFTRGLAKQIAPTERSYKQFQLQAASFADRMAKSEGLLQPFEEVDPTTNLPKTDLINNTSSALEKIPLAGKYLANKTLSTDQQLYKNAADEWIRAKLRKESGAAIGNDEMDKEYRTYFPMPGDSVKVIQQKASLRKNNTASMIKQASGAYEEQYLGETPGNTSSAPTMSNPSKVLIFDSKGNIVK